MAAVVTQKMLTVCIPAFNMQDYLERNVMSMVEASHAALLDILIVDDGSTDETLLLAQRLEGQYPGIVRCVQKDNGHYGSAVNCAMRCALGRFFKIIDADDTVDSHALDILLEFLCGEAFEADVVLTDYVLHFDNAQNDEEEEKYFPATNILASGQVVDFSSLVIETQLMHAVCFRTELLQANGITLDERTAFTDEEFAVYPMPFVHTIGYCAAPVYRYHVGREGQSISAAQLDKTIDQNAFVTEQILSWYESLDNGLFSQAHFDYIAQKVCDVVVTHIRKRMIAAGSHGYKDYVRSLDERICKDAKLKQLVRLRSLKLCRATGYIAWDSVCREMKKHGYVLMG